MRKKKARMAVGAFGDMANITKIESPEVRRISPEKSEKVKGGPSRKAIKRKNRARESGK